MTIEQKAREIAEGTKSVDRVFYRFEVEKAARLGIIEGVKMAARVAEKIEDHTGEEIAAAIRALIEEQKI